MNTITTLKKIGGILLLVFIHAPLFGQHIDSMVVKPSPLIGVNDTVKIFVYNTFSSGGCAGNAHFSKSGFNVMAQALHCQGALTVICTDIDTIVLDPPHALGQYRFSFVLNSGFGGPPCTPGIVPNDFDTTYFTVGTNNAPTISPIENDTTCKNRSLGPLAFTVGDEDINSLVIHAYSDNQALIANSGINLSGTGTNRDVTLTPSANQLGKANITIVVDDNLNQRDSTVFEVYVVDCPLGTVTSTRAKIEIYPNPTSGDLVINLGKIHPKVELSLTNTEGREVKKWSFTQVEAIPLSIREESGMYMLTVSTDQGAFVYRLVLE
ncbi:MAG TPA: hypothetical protein DCX54_01400 [Flavobacteriales bacterium]|nr:hypothetical protein [Flavobacteriales bacterium]